MRNDDYRSTLSSAPHALRCRREGAERAALKALASAALDAACLFDDGADE